MKRSARRWALAIVGVLVLAGVVVIFIPKGQFSIVFGHWPTRVRAVFVDDATGKPLEDVWAISVQGRVLDDAALYSQRLARTHESDWDRMFHRREDRCDAVTGADGRFEVVVRVLWCTPIENDETYGPPSPFYGVETLVAEKDGYERRVVDCTKGRWIKEEREDYGRPYATVDVGEIRLRRRQD